MQCNSFSEKCIVWCVHSTLSEYRKIFIWGHSKKYVCWGRRGGEVHWKKNKNRVRWVLSCVYVRFFKKNAEIFKIKFYNYSPFFPLIIITVKIIKQTIMKDNNIQSCQWLACDRFRQPFLLCATFRSFPCTVHYFLCAFSAEMAAYSLVRENVYFVFSS